MRSLLLVLGFVTFCLFSQGQVSSLERDYFYEGIDLILGDSPIKYKQRKYRTDQVCKNCFINTFGLPHDDLCSDLIEFIPELPIACTEQVCLGCGGKPFYPGYIHFTYRQGYPFLHRQLFFMHKYSGFLAFWPEGSPQARAISDKAVILFSDLIENTELKNFYWYSSFRRKFVVDSQYLKKINKDIYIRSLVSSCFWFSDYYQVLEDLRIFAKDNLSLSGQRMIVQKIETILSQLESDYLELYLKVQSKRYIPEISQELELIKYLNGDWNQEEEYVQKECEEEFTDEQPQWFLAQYHFVKGQAYNQAMLYQEALRQLNLAINYDSGNSEAYLERALSYFELGQVDSAIDNYRKAKNLGFEDLRFAEKIPIQTNLIWGDQGGYVVINYAALAGEFCKGALEGACYSAEEFVPSTLGALSGMSQALWSFACSPNVVSKQFLDNMCTLVNFIRDNSTQEILEQMIPELRELLQNWAGLTNSEKSHRMGYIVGKYGFDIFAPCAGMKGLKSYLELRRANMMLTFECCLDHKKRVKILEEVAKREVWRRNLFKDGKVCIHWGMQNKHIPGTHNFDPARSKILVPKEHLSMLIENNCGNGQKIRGKVPYSPGYRERFDFKEVIGEYVKVGPDGKTISVTPTTKGIMHYSKKGVHLVPSDPYASVL